MSLNIKRENLHRYVYYGMPDGRRFRLMAIDRCSYIVGLDFNSATLSTGDIGCHSVHIGKYSSLGGRIHMILAMNHDYHSLYQGVIPEFATGEMGIRGIGQMFQRIRQKGQILIGNDVWIGDGVTILGGVRIGDGAVVAAESLVAKDVPPYAIVGGNPARIIKYRFPEETITRLRRIAWWNWSSEQIAGRREDMQGDVIAFAEKYDLPSLSRKDSSPVPRTAAKVPVFAYFMDFEDEYPVHTEVLFSFLKRYSRLEAQLLLCYDPQSKENREKMEILASMLQQYAAHSSVKLQEIPPEKEEEAIRGANLLITNRSLETLHRAALADKYGIPVLSGVDVPLFPQIQP